MSKPNISIWIDKKESEAPINAMFDNTSNVSALIFALNLTAEALTVKLKAKYGNDADAIAAATIADIE